MLCYNAVVTMLRSAEMSENDMISKKDLLERYGISYGTLYRWKRMGLIPDDWFVKTASPTGQQTFFPRRLICERVELIQSMKDDLSLASLAGSIAGKEKKEEYLLVQTDFGEYRFKESEIIQVSLICENETKTFIRRKKQ